MRYLFDTTDERAAWDNAVGLSGSPGLEDTFKLVSVRSWVNDSESRLDSLPVDYQTWARYDLFYTAGNLTVLRDGELLGSLEDVPDPASNRFYFVAYHLGCSGCLNNRLLLDELHVVKYVDPQPVVVMGEEQWRPVVNGTELGAVVSGPFDLTAYGGCVSGNFTPVFSGTNLTDWGCDGCGEREFCSAWDYPVHAWVENGTARAEFNRTVRVGNATVSQEWSLPVQSWTINASGNLSVVWEQELSFSLKGTARGDLNFTLFNRSFFFTNVAGPWNGSVVEPQANESVSVSANSTHNCTMYNFSRALDMHAWLAAPAHDPKVEHVVGGGVLENGSWWSEHWGNETLVAVCVATGREPGYLWCGDGSCSSGETCNTCPVDCSCPSGGSGGGGGWGGAAVVENETVENETTNVTWEPALEVESDVPLAVNWGPVEAVGGNVSFDGKVLVHGRGRVRVGEGYALSDGEKLYFGEVNLDGGNYSVVGVAWVEEEPEQLGRGWLVPAMLVVALIVLAARATKPF